jgi:hypothetical protein
MCTKNVSVVSRIPYFSAIYKRSPSRSGRFVQRKQLLKPNQTNEERKNCSQRSPGRAGPRHKCSNACLVLPLLCVTKYRYTVKYKWNYVVLILSRTKLDRQDSKCTSSTKVEILAPLVLLEIRKNYFKTYTGYICTSLETVSSFPTNTWRLKLQMCAETLVGLHV